MKRERGGGRGREKREEKNGGGGRPARKREVGPSEIIRHICKRGIVRYFAPLVIYRITPRFPFREPAYWSMMPVLCFDLIVTQNTNISLS